MSYTTSMNILKTAWKKWLKIARIIGNFQAQVLFTALYFLLFWIVGLITRNSGDPLKLRKNKVHSNFSPWEYKTETLDQARKPY